MDETFQPNELFPFSVFYLQHNVGESQYVDSKLQPSKNVSFPRKSAAILGVIIIYLFLKINLSIEKERKQLVQKAGVDEATILE